MLACRLCKRDNPCGTCDFTRSPFFPSYDLEGVHGFDREARLDDLGKMTTQKQHDPADRQPSKLRFEKRRLLPCTRLKVTASDGEHPCGQEPEDEALFPLTLLNPATTHNYISRDLADALNLETLRRDRIRKPRIGDRAEEALLDVVELFIHSKPDSKGFCNSSFIEAYVVEMVCDERYVALPTRRAYHALIRGDSYSAPVVKRTPQLLLGITLWAALGLQTGGPVPAGFTVFESDAGPIIAGEGWVSFPANDAACSDESGDSDFSPYDDHVDSDADSDFNYGLEPQFEDAQVHATPKKERVIALGSANRPLRTPTNVDTSYVSEVHYYIYN
ncbi:hypothetical protein AAVH_42488 [Aphelenchoides avenae]|nr:hypothetical protein AAVH_42488 [Aphelenchus avenae]